MSILHPATVIISGGTGSGKTEFTKQLIRNHRNVFIELPRKPKVLWCYGVIQNFDPSDFGEVYIKFIDGMITENLLVNSKPDILVIDDMMNEKSNDKFLHNLFTKFSHHYKVTVIYITQNLYESGQCKMKRNSHYLVMMRNPSDKSQITTLGRQLFTRNVKGLNYFFESYDDATKERYGYLFIDVSPTSEPDFMLKTNIVPGDKVIVYQQK